MDAKVIDGKAIAASLNEETATSVAALARNHNLQPGLAVILVGEDPASKVYVNMKVKKSLELGIFSDKRVLAENAAQEEVLSIVNELNGDKRIHGILIQSPLPPQINESDVIFSINPAKDVDCFHPENVGRMFLGEERVFFPCTPYGIMVLLERSGIDPCGKHVVILGRSNIVGKPMMALLTQKRNGANATVTVCHSKTVDIAKYAKQADILIAAIGKPGFVTGDMVKEGAVVIDVGINRVKDENSSKGYKLVGDVVFDEAVKKASYITPVPGGIGPMTIAMLMHNALKACKMQNGLL